MLWATAVVAWFRSRLFFLSCRSGFAPASALFLLSQRSSTEARRLLATVPLFHHRNHPDHLPSFGFRPLAPRSAPAPATAVVAACSGWPKRLWGWQPVRRSRGSSLFSGRILSPSVSPSNVTIPAPRRHPTEVSLCRRCARNDTGVLSPFFKESAHDRQRTRRGGPVSLRGDQ